MKKQICTTKKILEHGKSWRKSRNLRTKHMNKDSNMTTKKDMKICHESSSTRIITHTHIHNTNTPITHIIMYASIYLCVYVLYVMIIFVRFIACLTDTDFLSSIRIPDLLWLRLQILFCKIIYLILFLHLKNFIKYESRIQL